MTDHTPSFPATLPSSITLYRVDQYTGDMREIPCRLTAKLIIVNDGSVSSQHLRREYYYDGRMPGLHRFTPAEARDAFQTYAADEARKAQAAADRWHALSLIGQPESTE